MTDDDVRVHIYERFVATGAPPSVAETATALGASEDEVADSYRRLEQTRVIVLAPGTLNVWLANPFCASPTAFRVHTPRGEHWGICAWDALGVVATLGGEGTVRTTCADCADPLELRVRDRKLDPVEGVFHVAVPARSWWENIAFT